MVLINIGMTAIRGARPIKNLAVKNRNVTAAQVSIALRGNNQFTPVVS